MSKSSNFWLLPEGVAPEAFSTRGALSYVKKSRSPSDRRVRSPASNFERDSYKRTQWSILRWAWPFRYLHSIECWSPSRSLPSMAQETDSLPAMSFRNSILLDVCCALASITPLFRTILSKDFIGCPFNIQEIRGRAWKYSSNVPAPCWSTGFTKLLSTGQFGVDRPFYSSSLCSFSHHARAVNSSLPYIAF